MRLTHLGIGRHDAQNLLLHIGRKRTLQQLVQPRADQIEGHLEDEHRHDERRDGVGDTPLLAQKIGAGDADERPQRRQGVAAVVPGIGHDARAVDRTAFTDGVAVENLLDDDRHPSRHEGHQPRPGQQSAVDHDADVADAAGENPGPHDPQREAYDDRGEGFVLPVAVIVAVVPGLGGNPREGDHHHIRRQVGERMDGIGHHRSAPPDDSGGKFQHRQHQVDHEPHKGHAVDFTFPDFRFAGHRLKRLKFKNTLFFRLSRN